MDSQMMQKIKDLSTDFDKVFKTFENSFTDTEKSNWIIALITSIKDPSLYRNVKVIITKHSWCYWYGCFLFISLN
ncbi:hypothetical protein AAHB57_28570 [Bacillus cereus]